MSNHQHGRNLGVKTQGRYIKKTRNQAVRSYLHSAREHYLWKTGENKYDRAFRVMDRVLDYINRYYYI